MIFWVTAEAAGMPCDQRARLVEVINGKTLRVELQGTGAVIDVAPFQTCGVEFGSGPKTGLRYKITSQYSSDK